MPISNAAKNSRAFKKSVSDAAKSNVMLMKPTMQEPEYDSGESDRLKRLAKQNMLGKGLSSIFQLAGVASGGDAVNLGDTTGNFVLQGLRDLDLKHEAQLRDYTDQLFRTGMYNNQMQNSAAQDDLLFDRNLEMNDLQQKQSFDAEMMKAGIDPQDPKAREKYFKKKQELFDLDKKNTNSLISARNQSSGGGKKGINAEFLNAALRGREIRMNQIKTQIQKLREGEYGGQGNIEQIERLQKQLDKLIDFDIKPDNSLSLTLAELGRAPGPFRLDPNNISDVNSAMASSMTTDSDALSQGIVNPNKEKSSMNHAKALEILSKDPSNKEAKEFLVQEYMIHTESTREEALAQINKRFKPSK